LGNWIVGITTKTENKSKINVIQQNQNPAHKTLLEETQTFKITVYHLHTASTIYKKKTGLYKQKWMQ